MVPGAVLDCVRRGLHQGRVNFYNEMVESSSPANGSVFVYLGPCVQAFKQAFDSNCLVLFTQEALSHQETGYGP